MLYGVRDKRFEADVWARFILKEKSNFAGKFLPIKYYIWRYDDSNLSLKLGHRERRREDRPKNVKQVKQETSIHFNSDVRSTQPLIKHGWMKTVTM